MKTSDKILYIPTGDDVLASRPVIHFEVVLWNLHYLQNRLVRRLRYISSFPNFRRRWQPLEPGFRLSFHEARQISIPIQISVHVIFFSLWSDKWWSIYKKITKWFLIRTSIVGGMKNEFTDFTKIFTITQWIDINFYMNSQHAVNSPPVGYYSEKLF